MLYRCLECGNDFSYTGYPQCPVRSCRSYEVISYAQIDEIKRVTSYFIRTTHLGLLPTLDAVSAIFHTVGLRKFKPENTMKLVKIVLGELNASGKVSFKDIIIADDSQKRSL